MNSHNRLPRYRKIWGVLNGHERRRAFFQLLLAAVGMFLETMGISLVIPAVLLMTQEDPGSTYPVVQPVLDALGNPSQVQLIVGGMCVLVSVFAIKSGFLAFLVWSQNRFAFDIRVRLSERLFTTYLRQPYAFHLQRNSAMLIRNARSETQQLITNGVRPAFVLITEGMLLVGIASLLVLVEPMGALAVVAVLGSAALGFHHFFRKRLSGWGETRRYHDGQCIKHMQQGFGSVKDIKLMGREREFVKQYRSHNKRGAYAARKQATLAQMPRLWLELLAVSGLATLVLTMTLQGRETISILATLSVFAVAAFRLIPSVNKVLTAVQSIRFVSTVIDHIYDELQLPAPDLPKRRDGSPDEFHREIRIETMNFTYPGAARPALCSASFSIAKGETVGFIGPSGSGKSTLIDMILGMLQPDSGGVMVDGEDIHLNLRRWQDQIGYVPQSIYLTDESLRRNVAFGIANEDIDDAAVERAIKVARLEEFVAELPDGLETVVGERGVRLSGGQRQRIGIARALYHDPQVLVLDEATSALDMATEQVVMKAVYAMHGTKTILIVAHRLSTVENCDRIIRLQEGRIVEEGPPGVVLVAAPDSKSPAHAAVPGRG